MFFTNHFFLLRDLSSIYLLFFFAFKYAIITWNIYIYRPALLLSFFLSFFHLVWMFLIKNVSPILASTNDLKERYVEGFKGCLDRQLWIEVKRICFGAYPNPVRRLFWHLHLDRKIETFCRGDFIISFEEMPLSVV